MRLVRTSYWIYMVFSRAKSKNLSIYSIEEKIFSDVSFLLNWHSRIRIKIIFKVYLSVNVDSRNTRFFDTVSRSVQLKIEKNDDGLLEKVTTLKELVLTSKKRFACAWSTGWLDIIEIARSQTVKVTGAGASDGIGAARYRFNLLHT